MMNRTFIPKNIQYSILFFLVVSLFFFPFSFFLLFSLISSLIFIAFRKPKPIYRDRVKKSAAIFLAPVNAIVERVRDVRIEEKEYKEITMLVGVFSQWALHLPLSAEVDEILSHEGKKKWSLLSLPTAIEDLNALKQTQVFLRSKHDKRVILKFFPSILGISPVIWPTSGDRGIAASCFGFFPLGGKVQILLPSASKIFVSEGDILLAGDSVVANLQ